jgi:16S rRNA processing protein RimM
MDTNFIPIGKIEGVHGTKGAVKVLLLSDFSERLAPSSSVLVMKDGINERRSVSHCRFHKQRAVVRFMGIHTVDDAKQLSGSLLCIKEEELTPLPANTYYIHTLIGFGVYDENQKHLGTLTEVWRLPANDVFVVRDDSSETLFPAVKEAITRISPEEKRITVNSELGVS